MDGQLCGLLAFRRTRAVPSSYLAITLIAAGIIPWPAFLLQGAGRYLRTPLFAFESGNFILQLLDQLILQR